MNNRSSGVWPHLDVPWVQLVCCLHFIDDLGGCVEAVLVCDEVKAERRWWLCQQRPSSHTQLILEVKQSLGQSSHLLLLDNEVIHDIQDIHYIVTVNRSLKEVHCHGIIEIQQPSLWNNLLANFPLLAWTWYHWCLKDRKEEGSLACNGQLSRACVKMKATSSGGRYSRSFSLESNGTASCCRLNAGNGSMLVGSCFSWVSVRSSWAAAADGLRRGAGWTSLHPQRNITTAAQVSSRKACHRWRIRRNMIQKYDEEG